MCKATKVGYRKTGRRISRDARKAVTVIRVSANRKRIRRINTLYMLNNKKIRRLIMRFSRYDLLKRICREPKLLNYSLLLYIPNNEKFVEYSRITAQF